MIWVGGETGDLGANIVDCLRSTGRWYVLMFPSTIGSAYLAAGRIAGMVYHGTSPEPSHGSVHSAAGCFVASEAGAVVTDLVDGVAWRPNTPSLLMAATPSLHDELKRAIKIVVG